MPDRPRDGGLHLELTEGTGPILLMSSAGDRLEIYKIDRCFEVLSPDDNDPNQLDPNAPWIVKQVTKYGAGNPIVARTVLQADAMLKQGTFKPIVDKTNIMRFARRCRDAIVECKRLSDEINASVDNIVRTYRPAAQGNVFTSFPSYENLREDAGAFLLHAKQALQETAGIINGFFAQSFKGPHFHKVRDWLAIELPGSEILAYIERNESIAKHIVDLRNGLEHPSQSTTEIRDFYWDPETRKIHLPDWNLKGEKPGSLAKETVAITDFLVDFTEAVVVMSAVMQVDLFPHRLVENDPLPPEMPVRYGLEIDPAVLGGGSSSPMG